MSATHRPGLVRRDVGEGPFPRHVAHRPDPGSTRMRPSTGMAGASSSRPSTPTPRAPRSLRRPVATSIRGAGHRAPAGQVHGGAGAHPPARPTRSGAGQHLEPLAPEDLGDQLGRLGLLGAGEARAELDDGDRAPKRPMT